MNRLCLSFSVSADSSFPAASCPARCCTAEYLFARFPLSPIARGRSSAPHPLSRQWVCYPSRTLFFTPCSDRHVAFSHFLCCCARELSFDRFDHTTFASCAFSCGSCGPLLVSSCELLAPPHPTVAIGCVLGKTLLSDLSRLFAPRLSLLGVIFGSIRPFPTVRHLPSAGPLIHSPPGGSARVLQLRSPADQTDRRCLVSLSLRI